MKFSCNQQLLNKALSTVSKAITSRTTIPILKDIYLEAKEDKVLLRASDLNLSIETEIICDVESTGSVAIPSKLFIEIVRKLPNQHITLENLNGQVSLKTLTSEFNLTSHNPDDFPSFNTVESLDKRLLLDREVLKNMIRRTNFSASVDESRPNLTGILFEIEKNSLNMVSSDGFRISVSREEMQNEIEENLVINAKILSEIFKILSESTSDDDVEIVIGDKDMLVKIDNTKVFLRVMDVKYISYKEILPKDYSTIIKVDTKDLLSAIERASLMAKEGKNNLIKCSVGEGFLTITSRSEEGSVKEEIFIDKNGESLDIGFNSKYVIDALKVIDDDEILIEFKSNLSPCAIKPMEGSEFQYLILPVRIV